MYGHPGTPQQPPVPTGTPTPPGPVPTPLPREVGIVPGGGSSPPSGPPSVSSAAGLGVGMVQGGGGGATTPSGPTGGGGTAEWPAGSPDSRASVLEEHNEALQRKLDAMARREMRLLARVDAVERSMEAAAVGGPERSGRGGARALPPRPEPDPAHAISDEGTPAATQAGLTSPTRLVHGHSFASMPEVSDITPASRHGRPSSGHGWGSPPAAASPTVAGTGAAAGQDSDDSEEEQKTVALSSGRDPSVARPRRHK